MTSDNMTVSVSLPKFITTMYDSCSNNDLIVNDYNNEKIINKKMQCIIFHKIIN